MSMFTPTDRNDKDSWFTILEFPSYEVNYNLEVRRIGSKRLLKPYKPARGKEYYALWKDGKSRKVPKELVFWMSDVARNLSDKELGELYGWLSIPGFDRYQFHPVHGVRNKSTGRILKGEKLVGKKGYQQSLYYLESNDGKQRQVRRSWLMMEMFH